MNTTTLIAVTPGDIGGQSAQLVDARLLHDFLEVGRDFSTWIKLRIRQYGFEQNRDYLLAQTGEKVQFDSPVLGNQTLKEVQDDSPNLVKNAQGGDRRSVDYLLTLDMAKELAMVERTPKGRQARRYFIDCEKALRSGQQVAAKAQAQAQAQAQTPPAAPYRLSINLRTANLQAINRQAQADVAGENAQRLHARREELLRLQRHLCLYGSLPPDALKAGGGQ